MSLSLPVSVIVEKTKNPLLKKHPNWKRIELKDIALVINGFAFKSKFFNKKELGLPIIRIRDVVRGKAETYYSGEFYEVYLVNKGDLLIGMDGDFNCRKWQGEVALLNQRVCKIIFKSKYYNFNFLYYVLPGYLEEINRNTSAVTVKHLSSKSVLDITLPLPPLNEQKRIATKLDQIMPRVEAVKEWLERIPLLIKRFRQSVLTAAVTGKLTEKWREEHPNIENAEVLLERLREERKWNYNQECEVAKKVGRKRPKKPSNLTPNKVLRNDIEIPSSWIWITFEDISSTKQYAMSSGPFGSALGTKDYISKGIPVIRGRNIMDGKFVFKDFVYISKEKAELLKRSSAFPGDIVIIAVGSSGNSAIVPNNLSEAILSQNCNKFTLDPLIAIPEFINFSLQISILKGQMKSVTTDTARQFLSLTNLKKMLFTIPPLEEQKEIVRQVDKLFSFADKLEAHYQKAKEKILKLPQSILAKAFRGELVPQDPNDEHAHILLEKIKAQKQKLLKGVQPCGAGSQ